MLNSYILINIVRKDNKFTKHILPLPAAGSTRKGELTDPLLHSEGNEGGVVLVMEYIGLSATIILNLSTLSFYKYCFLDFITTEALIRQVVNVPCLW